MKTALPTGRDRSCDLAGRLLLRTLGLSEAQERIVADELDPFALLPVTLDGAAADVELVHLPAVDLDDLVELHGPSHDGTTTARDARGRLLLGACGQWASVPRLHDRPVRIGLTAGAPARDVWRSVVRPALQHALHAREAVAAHAAAVEDEAGRAVLLSGWSESGKTEVALALMERGAHFLTDKWTVVDVDGGVSAFPVGVGVRGWVLDALPQLRAALPRRARAQLAAARAVGAAARPLRSTGPRGRLSGVALSALSRGVELGDRAGLAPTALRGVYGETADPSRRSELGTVVVLVTSPSERVVVQDVDVNWTARRLARTAAYERRRFFELQERGAYAELDGRAGSAEASRAREEDLLQRALGRAERLVRVACPFPGDPRRVADALLS